MKKEEIQKIHEIIDEVYPSKSMGDFGLKEQMCVEVFRYAEKTQEAMLEKAVKFLEEALQEKFDADESSVRMFLVDFKRAMKEE